MLPDKYKKKSFLKFSVDIDVEKLAVEFDSIPKSKWGSSYWGQVHCSVATLLLRGGNTNTPDDFAATELHDDDLLSSLPYIDSLIGEDGPFGKASYAFLFRMVANGVTLAHRDLQEVWKGMYRIHIPITSNEDAVLISGNKMVNFTPGYAWTFDNFEVHGVVNGDTERTHLILDVPLNEKVMKQIDSAEFVEGWEDQEKIEIITNKGSSKIVVSYPGDASIREMIESYQSKGWDLEKVVSTLNQECIPSKKYGEKWTAQAVFALHPFLRW